MTRPRFVFVAIVLCAIGFGAGFGFRALRPAAPKQHANLAKAFSPPPDIANPAGPLDEEVALGRLIFTDTPKAAPGFVGNDLKCSNCHLDGGRRANAAPLWAAYGLYPQYRTKNGHVNTFAERIQECFKYSMNGKAPPAGDRVLVAVESYAAFLATGAPHGARLPGQGYLKLPKPPLPADYARGQLLYAATCARCHGADGGGQRADGQVLFPPLWGERSYNWGAGMADMQNAAGFVAANMPQDHPGTLTNQQAWDVAAFIDGKPRPQDPRFTGSLAETRARYHDTPQSAYGRTVDGVLLGGDGRGRRGVPSTASKL
jgi:thiosulfate dehydrogenase